MKGKHQVRIINSCLFTIVSLTKQIMKFSTQLYYNFSLFNVYVLHFLFLDLYFSLRLTIDLSFVVDNYLSHPSCLPDYFGIQKKKKILLFCAWISQCGKKKNLEKGENLAGLTLNCYTLLSGLSSTSETNRDMAVIKD